MLLLILTATVLQNVLIPTVTDMPMYMARLIRQARTVQTTAPTAILTAVTDTTAANRQKIIRRSMITRIIRIYNSYM